jgi:type II secretory pathway component PulC
MFKDLGLKDGYIILSINGRKIRNTSEINQILKNESDLNSIEGIQPNGTMFSFSFRN